MRHQQADKGHRTRHANAGPHQNEHQKVERQTQPGKIHPQRLCSTVAHVEQVQLICQQQHDRRGDHHDRKELPKRLPASVRHPARQPVENAVSVIFRQQQRDARQGHAKG